MLVRGAWLHHAFVCIHPFEDGNGRVARVLTLLSVLAGEYAPLVVDRDRRDEYLDALNAANEGDLRVLIHLFAELEIIALRAELEAPLARAAGVEGAASVARAVVSRLRDVRRAGTVERRAAAESLASAMHDRLREHLSAEGEQVAAAFAELDETARCSVDGARPPEERARWWRIQLVDAARRVDFFANLGAGAWWVRLRLVVAGQELRYVAAVQKVGRGESGVLAVTVFAEQPAPHATSPGEDRRLPQRLLDITTADSVTLVHTDTVEGRWPDVDALTERTLAAAVARFGESLT